MPASPPPDVASFVAAVPAAAREAYAVWDGLADALARLVVAARAYDPGLDARRFLHDVAARVDPEASPEAALGAIRAADLALAIACARGEPDALARFDREMSAQIEIALARQRYVAIDLDELRQAIRDWLFVATPDVAPRIASYLGRGDLKTWVRMVAVRYLIDVGRAAAARPEQLGSDEALADLATGTDDPELAFLKRQYRDDFRAAFGAVLATLEPRERTLLRHRYLDGLEVAEIAALHGMHRVSMSRTLGRIRDDLLDGIRREFRRRLGVGADELDGIMALIGSQLELSLSGLLRR